MIEFNMAWYGQACAKEIKKETKKKLRVEI